MSVIKRHALLIAALAGAAVFGVIFLEDLVDWFAGTTGPTSMPASMPASAPASRPGSIPASGPASQPGSRPTEVAHYTCSMHPSVEQAVPGTCPICAMDLTPVTKEEVETGTIVVDAIRRQRIGVRVARVERRALVHTVRAVGVVAYDETRQVDVNLRMSGWVQHLDVDETGQKVMRGQTLFRLYSPELYAAQVEHLSALSRSKGRSAALLELAAASRRRLELLGLTGAQIDQLEAGKRPRDATSIRSPASGYVVEKALVAGAYVRAGTRAYRIVDLSAVWIEAEVFESELALVRVGQPARITLPHASAPAVEGTVDYVHPTLDPETRTARVRVEVSNSSLVLRPDMFAEMEIAVALGERLVVPQSAVVYTGPRRLVFVDLGEGRLRPTVVQVGVRAGGYDEITEGLAEGDVVVSSGNFLIAAESRIRSATKYWEPSDGTD